MSNLRVLHEAATPAPWMMTDRAPYLMPEQEFMDKLLVVALRNAYAEGRLVEVGRCGECRYQAAFTDKAHWLCYQGDDEGFCNRFETREVTE